MKTQSEGLWHVRIAKGGWASYGQRYGLAFLLALGAMLLCLSFSAYFHHSLIFAFGSVTIALSAGLGGLGPGLFATTLSALLAYHWFIGPHGAMAMTSTQALGEIVTFLITGGLLSFIIDALHRSRRQAEEEAEHFHTLFSRAAIGKALVDPATGRFVLVNRKFGEITGYSEQELLGMTFRHLTHPEDWEESELRFGQLVRGEIAEYATERRHVRSDGRVIWVELLVTLTRTAEGQPLEAIGSIQDITRRKQAEEALRESEARYRQVIRSAGSVILGVDLAGRITMYNGEAQRVFGYTEKEVLGQHAVGTLVPPRDAAGREMHPYFSDLLHHIERHLYTENENLTKDGRRLWMAWTNRPIFDADGTMREIVCVGLDLTERKRIEDALRLSEERFRATYEYAPVGIEQVGLDGRLLEVNDALCRMLGYTREELLGKSFAQLTHPDDRAIEEKPLQQLLSSEVPSYQIEKRYLRKGGEPVWVCVTSALTHQPQSYRISIVEDITARKQEEALRAANEQLRQADRYKDEFLVMLAHELRNPLAPIRNAVQIIHLAGGHEPILQRQRDIIDRQVSHMARLLEDLLDVSRITRGTIVLQKQTLDLDEVLAHAVETLTPLIEARRHTLHVVLPAGRLLVEGDIDRLAQVVGNLLANAAKYTDEGGQIWLEGRREAEQAVISVRDSGMGITPEMLPRVFELFAQAEQSLAHSRGGLGIGLTMVQKLVQLHGGQVEAHSEGLGQGSEFIVRLPALAASAQDLTKPALNTHGDWRCAG